MTDYVTGNILCDPATGKIALRTHFDEAAFPNMAWLVASTNRGAEPIRSDDPALAGFIDTFEVVNGQIIVPGS